MSEEKVLDICGSSVRTTVRLKVNGVDVTPFTQDGYSLVPTTKLVEIRELVSELLQEMSTINPRIHPIRSEVMQRWCSVLSTLLGKI